MRYARYLRQEKYIAASDTGGIVERWKYGRRLLEDGEATTPAGNLRHGVLDRLLTHATAGGYKLSKSEINYRLQCARAYKTEAEISTACGDFETWSDLRAAGFPPVEVSDGGEPYDPRDADEKWRDFREEQERRNGGNPEQLAFGLPDFFPHDTYGPRTPVRTLVAHCDERERMTANFVKRDAEVRSYTDELVNATDGDLDMAWEDAERKRLERKRAE